MLFKELKPGFSVYILDKATMTFTTQKVTSPISIPHVDPKYSSPGMVVDITLSLFSPSPTATVPTASVPTPSSSVSGDRSPDNQTTYCVPCDTDTAYLTNKLLTTDRQNILREVESVKATSEQALSQIDHHKYLISQCTSLIADLDPSQREKQQMETRMSTMESNINKMMSLLTKLSAKP